MTIQERLEQIAELTSGKAWGLAQGKPRVYLRSRKDIKLFITFEDSAYSSPDQECDNAITGLFGAKMNCFIDECGQSPKWYASQKQIAIDAARPAFNAVCWLEHFDNLEEATRIIENEIEITDEAANHMINGRHQEAKAAIGL